MCVTCSMFISLLLASCPNHVHSMPPLVSCLHQVPSSPIAHLTSLLCPFEPSHSSPTSTMPSQAQLLVSDPATSFWAQLLVSHPTPGHFGPNHPCPTQPCQFKCNLLSLPCHFQPNHLFPTPTMLIQVQPLISSVLKSGLVQSFALSGHNWTVIGLLETSILCNCNCNQSRLVLISCDCSCNWLWTDMQLLQMTCILTPQGWACLITKMGSQLNGYWYQ